MRKKIGVLTFVNTVNYGAVLQSVALQKVLERLGYKSELINYKGVHKGLKNRRLYRKILSSIWRYLQYLLGYGIRVKRTKQFYLSNVSFSDITYNKEEDLFLYPPVYDYYIVGSDQIWNPNIIGDDMSYLLSFTNDNRKISYAASFGINSIPEYYKRIIKTELGGFSKISVREDVGKDILQELGYFDVQIVLDPTLLLRKEEWSELSFKEPLFTKYILCYYMPGNKVVTDTIKSVASKINKEKGYNIINIGKKETSVFNLFERNLIGIGPMEFINLFLNAEHIVTNSFHGTAFAINFQKPFFTIVEDEHIQNNSLSSRIKSLLKITGLEGQLISSSRFCDVDTFIEYDKVNEKLENERIKSINFLKNSLK